MFCVENNFKSSIRALTIPATFLFYIAQQEGGFAAKTKEEYERLLVQAVLFSVRFHCIHTEFFYRVSSCSGFGDHISTLSDKKKVNLHSGGKSESLYILINSRRVE